MWQTWQLWLSFPQGLSWAAMDLHRRLCFILRIPWCNSNNKLSWKQETSSKVPNDIGFQRGWANVLCKTGASKTRSHAVNACERCQPSRKSCNNRCTGTGIKAFYIVPRVQGKITWSNHRTAASQISDQKLHEYWWDWNPAENRNQHFEPPQLRMHLAIGFIRSLQLRCELLTNHPQVKEMEAPWDYEECDRKWCERALLWSSLDLISYTSLHLWIRSFLRRMRKVWINCCEAARLQATKRHQKTPSIVSKCRNVMYWFNPVHAMCPAKPQGNVVEVFIARGSLSRVPIAVRQSKRWRARSHGHTQSDVRFPGNSHSWMLGQVGQVARIGNNQQLLGHPYIT